jgi:hypothetical protein
VEQLGWVPTRVSPTFVPRLSAFYRNQKSRTQLLCGIVGV